jgi:hypothetical protein
MPVALKDQTFSNAGTASATKAQVATNSASAIHRFGEWFIQKNLPICAMVGADIKPFERDEDKFNYLASLWRNRNSGRSALNYYDFSYLQIIGMGKDALGYLLQEVQSGGRFWYMALKAITGQSADDESMHGNPEAVQAAWIDWGVKHGYLPRADTGQTPQYQRIPA